MLHNKLDEATCRSFSIHEKSIIITKTKYETMCITTMKIGYFQRGQLEGKIKINT